MLSETWRFRHSQKRLKGLPWRLGASQAVQWWNPPASVGHETQVRSLGQENPLEKEMAAGSSILATKFHGQRSLAGYSPHVHREPDTTESE